MGEDTIFDLVAGKNELAAGLAAAITQRDSMARDLVEVCAQRDRLLTEVTRLTGRRGGQDTRR